MAPQLLSRDLPKEHFSSLKKSYFVIKDRKNEWDEWYLYNYMIVFLQHFVYETFIDEELRNEIYLIVDSSYCDWNFFDGFFLSDIEKFFGEWFRFVNQINNKENNNKIVDHYKKSKWIGKINSFLEKEAKKHGLNAEEMGLIKKQ